MDAPLRAIVDIGTNSVLLLIGRRLTDGTVDIVAHASRIARLGEGVAQSGVLRADAVDRAVKILESYRQQARTWGATLVPVATAGIRLAKNPERFMDRAREVLGVPVRVLSGEEEARLSYLSVATEVAPDPNATDPIRVLDIGGGSTELVIGQGQTVTGFASHSIGSVRLTEAHVTRDPPPPDEIAALERAADAAFATQPIDPHPVLYGLAGTVTSVAAIHHGLREYDRDVIDGTRLTRDTVQEIRDRLASQTADERIATTTLGPGRADVIVAGTTILLRALHHCRAQELVVRDRGLRFALL